MLSHEDDDDFTSSDDQVEAVDTPPSNPVIQSNLPAADAE